MSLGIARLFVWTVLAVMPALLPGHVCETAKLCNDRPAHMAQEQGLVTIGDYLWNDYNGNGLQDDGGGMGISGATIWLFQDDGDGVFEPTSGDNYLQSTVTNGDGAYYLSVDTDDAYWIAVDNSSLPVGLASSPGAESLASPVLLQVAGEADRLEIDFGYTASASIWGTIFFDLNIDGMQGLGEEGVAGIEVCLYRDVNANQQLDAPDYSLNCLDTDYQGNYVFQLLSYGHYLAVETERPGMGNSTPRIVPVFLDPWVSSGVWANPIGDVVLCIIGDTVYTDNNGNGIQDLNETEGLSGVIITATSQSANEVYTAISDDNGHYQIPDLMPGVYEITAPAIVQQLLLTSEPIVTRDLGFGEATAEVDFGYITPTDVRLASFTAIETKSGVLIEWVTEYEDALDGFTIWRSVKENGDYKAVSGLVPARNKAAGSAYSWLDADIVPDQTYWYRLQTLPDNKHFGPVRAEADAGSAVEQVYMPIILY